jgi:hypothetical protein
VYRSESGRITVGERRRWVEVAALLNVSVGSDWALMVSSVARGWAERARPGVDVPPGDRHPPRLGSLRDGPRTITRLAPIRSPERG